METNACIPQEVPSLTPPVSEKLLKFGEMTPAELGFFISQFLPTSHVAMLLHEIVERIWALNDELEPYLSNKDESRPMFLSLQTELERAADLITEKGIIPCVCGCDDPGVIWDPVSLVRAYTQESQDLQQKQGQNLNGAPDTI